MKCTWCNGMGYYAITCPDCIDHDSTDGFCTTCQDSKFKKTECEDCNGSGEIDNE